jgi:nucleoid-associated protein YgaU
MANDANKLEKAYIVLLEPTPDGGGGSLGRVDFKFNPKEYSIQKSASWESKPARGATKTTMPEFKGAEPRSMTLEVFLDATDQGAKDIRKDIESLFNCCTPVTHTVGKNKPSPPFVQFCWGRTTSFTAFVKQVSVKYMLFKANGTPIRATASLTLQEIPRQNGPQNPTSGGLAVQRTHTVVSGDSLPSVAYQEYGRPALWRALADANRVDDPHRLPVGLHLLVPPAEEAVVSA